MNIFLLFLFLLLAISSSLCFYGRSARQIVLVLAFLDVGSPLCLYQTGWMRHFGQGERGGEHGFWISGLRMGKRAFWYGHGKVYFFLFLFLSWLSAWEATRMKRKAKVKIAFSDA